MRQLPKPIRRLHFSPFASGPDREHTLIESANIRLDNREPALSANDWASLRSWFREHGRHGLPWRVDTSPWGILLAEILLHRTRAVAVESVYRDVLDRFGSADEVVERPCEWLKVTRPAGLAWRAKTFISACEDILALHGSKVPSDRDALKTLPGIGHYIASAVRCFGFGFPEVLVDTNTIRLASRISGEPLNPTNHRSRIVKDIVARITENGVQASANDNYALLDLAALVCHPKSPECSRCPIASSCKMGRHLLAEPVPSGGIC